MKTNNAINNAIRVLLNSKNKKTTHKWQAIQLDTEIIEVNNAFIKMEICKTINDLSKQTTADLPWSEDHFIERISGSSNPGQQYKYWPYYRKDLDNNRFRIDGKFSHTYQERFWPMKKQGNRFQMGDWQDIKNRLKNDPTTRQAFLSIWHPEDQSNNNVRLPCTIGYWFYINNNKLDVTYLIRSCDARRHFRNDIYMAQRLAMEMLKNLEDEKIETGELSVWIGSFHCFISDIYSLNKILEKCADLQ
jgi:thymidylate synthase